jgi:hypothetical protein
MQSTPGSKTPKTPKTPKLRNIPIIGYGILLETTSCISYYRRNFSAPRQYAIEDVKKAFRKYDLHLIYRQDERVCALFRFWTEVRNGHSVFLNQPTYNDFLNLSLIERNIPLDPSKRTPQEQMEVASIIDINSVTSEPLVSIFISEQELQKESPSYFTYHNSDKKYPFDFYLQSEASSSNT